MVKRVREGIFRRVGLMKQWQDIRTRHNQLAKTNRQAGLRRREGMESICQQLTRPIVLIPNDTVNIRSVNSGAQKIGAIA